MSNEQTSEKLELDDYYKFQLAQAARWARFVGISGIVIGVLMILAGLFINGVLSGGTRNGMAVTMESLKGAISLMYIISGVISALVSYFLFRFSSQASTAVSFNRQDYLAHSFRNLKMVYQVMGFVIIAYLLISIFSGVFASMSGGGR